MIGRDEARARAERWFAGEVEIFEFESGYVVWPATETAVTPADPATQVPGDPATPGPGGPAPAPPAVTGVPRAVVDRRTGELTTYGSLPVPVVAEQYRAHLAAVRRFPPEVLADLYQTGWRPGRDQRAAVDAWLRRYADALSGLQPPAAARRALDEFGGLVLPQRGLRGAPRLGFPSWLFPFELCEPATPSCFSRVQGFVEETGIPAFPFGVHDDGPSDLVVDEAGRVLLLHWADDCLIGDSVEEALGWLLCGGRRPLSLNEDGTSPG